MTTPPTLLPTVREQVLTRLIEPDTYDVIIVGGGATGLGVALDAAVRGLSVALLESHDFAKGTSSRATKLLHGGVRYLAQGDFALVTEALHERAAILHNAPHLASALPFVVPTYTFWEGPFYGAGLKVYDALAGRLGLGATEFLGRRQTLEKLPGIRRDRLKGGVKYWDAQFDDARLALALARTAASRGAVLANYCPVTGLLYDEGRVAGVCFQDAETGKAHTVRSRCVINATGVWTDALREKDGVARHQHVKPLLTPSQGVHLVVERRFFPGEHALLVPRTADGRVLFAVPWLGSVILGTTDTPRADVAHEPQAFSSEVDFILNEAARYLEQAPTRADIRSIWVGLRPLVQPHDSHAERSDTRKISREHVVAFSTSGLVSVTGGKWTTYRSMAEDVMLQCAERGLLGDRPLPAGGTARYRLVGADERGTSARPLFEMQAEQAYGSEAGLLQSIDGYDRELLPGLTEAMVRFAARYEYARTTEDVLARRSRYLFLDAGRAASVAPAVAEIMVDETGVDPQLEEFLALARLYRTVP